MYSLPRFNFKFPVSEIFKNRVLGLAVLALIILLIVGFYTGNLFLNYVKTQIVSFLQKTSDSLPVLTIQKPTEEYVSVISFEQAIINAVKSASPSVVSIIISKDLPVYERQFVNPFEEFSFDIQIPRYVPKGTQRQQVGAGSGFIVSKDGLILTNKHVVLDQQAEYTVFTNDGKRYSAKVLALDPVQDLAVMKIQDDNELPAIKIGDSSTIQIGQTAIAIGNALGEFRNTVSVGVISGLGRNVLASGSQGFSELLEDVIQTDAAINPGNSGGPLVNLKGEVVGVNVAMAQGAQSIGFAIPINVAKRDIEQVVKTNKITYPFLGVRYVIVDEAVKNQYKLQVDSGAFILKGQGGEPAITKGSAAEKAGLKEGDIILEFNGEKISKDRTMSLIIAKYSPGDKVILKVLRDGKEIFIEAVLGERS